MLNFLRQLKKIDNSLFSKAKDSNLSINLRFTTLEGSQAKDSSFFKGLNGFNGRVLVKKKNSKIKCAIS